MKSKSNPLNTISIFLIVTLYITGCSASTIGSQTPSGMGSSDKDQSSNREITVEGVAVSDTNITFHGKSTLPAESCIETQLLADGTLLPWWPDDTCADQQQRAWELKVPLGDNKLQTDVQYVLNVYQRDDKNVTTNFPFDLSGPPLPSE